MAERLASVPLFATLLTCGVLAAAQQPPTAPDGTAPITLGQSSVPLNGPWKFQIGDSPADPANGKPLWAEPGFDDSKWETMDLTPQAGTADPWNGDPRWVPGWTLKGHPGYTGWAWYRLRVRVSGPAGERLAVNAPAQADDAYQIFANGELIGSSGEFDGRAKPRVTYWATPNMFLVPPATASEGSAGDAVRTVTFAYRAWMGPVGIIYAVSPGGLHYAPMLVTAGSMEAQRKLDWDQIILTNIYVCFEGAAFLLLAMLAASVLLFDRSDPVYLWVTGALMLTVADDASAIATRYTHLIGAKNFFLINFILFDLLLGTWAMVWWVWFQLRRPAWVPKAIVVLTLGCIATDAMCSVLTYNFLPRAVWSAFVSADFVIRVAFMFLFLLIVILGIRKEGKEGWLALAAVLPMAIQLFGSELGRVLGVGLAAHPFGVTFFLTSLGSLTLVATLGLLMLRRLLRSLHRQRQLALDVKQAQEVQQVILPQARTTLPGLEIECDYRPAREVGGDFFQIIPSKPDGSVLIVAGDVTGKGLKAGMLVALLVGAIRTAAKFDPDPVAVLRELNERLLGRSDAQATCLALQIEQDGSVTLANAGHLAPYLNGEPVKMEGALPLGMIEGAEFSVMRFKLSDRDRLMLLSDGIAEATDVSGKLFGFERVYELLQKARSAAEVATAAQLFGQEDDISVISVTRKAQVLPAVAPSQGIPLSADGAHF
jgi:Stage II sporulation protein E (SpoIIE)